MVCPDVAISFDEKGKRYLVDMEHCKGAAYVLWNVRVPP
jgi:Pyruvate/2-oxoacid:ferredoxin oxidoreductase delta subunit